MIALDNDGESYSTEQFADRLSQWQQAGRSVTFLIGGAEGLSQACFKRANLVLSLSKLTFPHTLARVILVEQLYRAWSILENKPYHKISRRDKNIRCPPWKGGTREADSPG